MLRFAANLSMLYPEHVFLDRFEAAAKDGFRAVEYLFPYDIDPAELSARLRANDLQQVLFNAPPGQWAQGERGLACLPGREAEFRQGIDLALRYADALACPRIHVLAGIPAQGTSVDAWRTRYLDNLRHAAKAAATQGVDILIEPLNTRDVPGYPLNRQDEAHAIVEELGLPNVKVQFDLYHCQIVEGDVATKIAKYLPTGRVGHLQIAGVPQRHEPDVGELNAAYLLSVVNETGNACGWSGFIGCEYRPQRGSAEGGTSQGLDWMRAAERAGR